MVSYLLGTMLFFIKPILFKFLTSNSVRQLVIDLLEAYAKSTDNTIDDAAVELVKNNIFPKEGWHLLYNTLY